MKSQEYIELGGNQEVAELLGVSKQNLAQLRLHPDFPPPFASLACGPIWKLEHIQRWMTSGYRRGRGRPLLEEIRVIGDRFEIDKLPFYGDEFIDIYRGIDRLGIITNEDQVVAVKILRSKVKEHEEMLQLSFLQTLTKIKHPHILNIIDFGVDDKWEQLWYVSSLPKSTLFDHLQFITDDSEIIDIFQQICTAIQIIYKETEPTFNIHTPMNICLTKVSTWAISNFNLPMGIDQFTLSQILTAVTFLYMAPETMPDKIFNAEKATIYNLGKLLQALVIQKHPFPGIPLPENPFKSIITKATRYRPSERYNSIQEMLLNVTQIHPNTFNSNLFGCLEERARFGEKNALNQLLETMIDATKNDDIKKESFSVLMQVATNDIIYLWEENQNAYLEAFKLLANNIVQKNWTFDCYAEIADYIQKTNSVIQDDEILSTAITVLCAMQENQHAQSVLFILLQEIYVSDSAQVALNAIQESAYDNILNLMQKESFLLHSLHPILFTGISTLLQKQSNHL